MDAHLVDKRLAWIEAACERLRRLAVPDRIATDELQRAFVEHTLQTAIQAAIDVAAWILGERKLGEPNSTRSMFRLLAQDGWVTVEQAEVWRRIVGFRNIVVHRYLDVDPAIVRAVLVANLGDFGAFVQSIRARLAELRG